MSQHSKKRNQKRMEQMETVQVQQTENVQEAVSVAPVTVVPAEPVASEKEKQGNVFSTLCLTTRRNTRRVYRRWRNLKREEEAQHFPESENLLVQMVLLFWNVFPMMGDSVQKKTKSFRRRLPRHASSCRESRRLQPLVCMSLACCLVLTAVFWQDYTIGTVVSYDGQIVASVDSETTAEEVRSDLERVTAQTLGATYTIDDSLLRYSPSLMRRENVVDEETLGHDLSKEIGLVTSAYSLYVDGERIGATTYEGALEELLEQMKGAALNEDTILCEFAEEVEIRQEFVPSEEIMNLGHIAETLYSTKTEEMTYTVVKGDTWSEIAEAHGLTSQELLALNPGYDIDKLQIGEILTLSASVPYLTMTVVQQEHYVVDVPFEIEYTDTPDLYKGDYQVTSAGEYGVADVVANVTYVNGEEVKRVILSTVTLKEPVTEQRLQGTTERPTWNPTGTFRWPTTGRISSNFGGRKSPGGIGSTNHKGIDIANSYGTPIYAADGGTVTYAGWMSGYGYTVRIDHGNGYVTYYAHNSSLTVQNGARVYKGQQIAKMGSTGNSTGNHCHFEVRYHGVAKNPINYLP